MRYYLIATSCSNVLSAAITTAKAFTDPPGGVVPRLPLNRRSDSKLHDAMKIIPNKFGERQKLAVRPCGRYFVTPEYDLKYV